MANLLEDLNPAKALVGGVVDLLKGIGLIKDPEQEAKAKQLAAEIELRLKESEIRFVEATTPDPNRVYVWVNSFIALIRPMISTLIVGTMAFAPERLILLAKAFAEAGPAGWVVLSPVLWWFFGRDISKIFGMKFNGGTDVGSGASTHPRLPDESRERWGRIDRLMEKLESRTQ